MPMVTGSTHATLAAAAADCVATSWWNAVGWRIVRNTPKFGSSGCVAACCIANLRAPRACATRVRERIAKECARSFVPRACG